MEQPKGLGTLSVHLGHRAESSTGAIVPSISLSTTFEQRSPGVPWSEFEYSRTSNPTRKLLENAIAKLDNAKHGKPRLETFDFVGLAFASGSAATAILGHLLEPGAHVISASDVYGGTKRFFTQTLSNFGIEVSYTRMDTVEALKSLFKPTTKMIWIETPTNPNLHIVDIKAVCKLAHSIHPDIIVVVDNTFMTPYLQRPLELDADIVSYSATKYLNGHCDVIMGLLVTNNDQLYHRLQFLQNTIGAIPSPLDCYLCMRGMRTLHLRMERHCKNAMKVATFLVSHPMVEKVFYPGLPSHPNHEVTKKQQSGFGGMVSFRLKGDLTNTCKFSKSTKIFMLAESLGGVESLIDVPAVMTHGTVSPHERKELGITDSFIRLSVGIEDGDDLVADLKQALDVTFAMN